jgi:hypothetical protein
MNMRLRHIACRLRKTLPRIALALALGGCAGAPPAPAFDTDLHLPRQAHVVQREDGQPDLDRMLAVQQEGPASRWSLFDPLGVPLARQLLQNGRWRSDGLLPPNRQARTLFAALAFAWMPENALDQAYGPGAWRQQTLPDGRRQRLFLRDGSPRWIIEWPASSAAQDTFMIMQADGMRWLLAPLKEQP